MKVYPYPKNEFWVILTICKFVKSIVKNRFNTISILFFKLINSQICFYLLQTHFFVFNSGFQTWEYAPPYALRSYLYVLIHAVPVYIYKVFFNTRKVMLFYLIRCVLALLCALCELYFYKYLFIYHHNSYNLVVFYIFVWTFRAISKKISSTVGKYYLFITIFSPGMFIASTAYLPSSFSM